MRASFFPFIRRLYLDCRSELQCRQFMQHVGFMPHLTNLQFIVSTRQCFDWPESLQHITLKALTNLSIESHFDVAEGLLTTVTTPALVTLRISCGLEESQQMFQAIGAMRTLRHLHLSLPIYDSCWNLTSMLSWFDDLPELITFRFHAYMPDTEVDEYLTEADAHTIMEFFPNLRVLSVEFATFQFFIRILKHPQLESLTLDASYWLPGDRDTQTTPCPGLHTLRFSGCPDDWVPGPIGLNICGEAVKKERFPKITSLDVANMDTSPWW